MTKPNGYIKKLLSDTAGLPSTRLHMAWLLTGTAIGLAFLQIFFMKNCYEIIQLFLLTGVASAGVSVLGEIKNGKH